MQYLYNVANLRQLFCMGLSTSHRDIGLLKENKGPNVFSSETEYIASLFYEVALFIWRANCT